MQQWQRRRGHFVVVKQRHVDRGVAPPTQPTATIETNLNSLSRLESVRQFGALCVRLLVSLGVLLLAGMSMVGVGAWAAFNSTASQSASYSTGTVTLTLGATGNPANTLATNASNLAPGDTIQRTVDVINGGTIDWSTLNLTTAATASSTLDTDTTNGLRITVDECTAAWSGGPAPAAYTCGGTTNNRINNVAVITNTNIGSAALTAGTTAHYRITLTLPTSAPTTMQSLSSTINYTFTATQRAGVAK